MIVVGLTGGIGSGKSTVSQLLADRGAVIVDADAIVHELQEPGQPLLDELAERFGDDIITPMVPSIGPSSPTAVFEDAEAVKDLNAIVHPAVRAEIVRRVAGHAGTDNVVVLDIPLITERDTYAMAGLVVVDVPVEVAIERVVADRQMSERRDSRPDCPSDLARATPGLGRSGDRQLRRSRRPATPGRRGLGLDPHAAAASRLTWTPSRSSSSPRSRCSPSPTGWRSASGTRPAGASPSRRRRALLVGIAAVAGEMEGAARVALVVAVVLCLAGDVALLGDSESGSWSAWQRSPSAISPTSSRRCSSGCRGPGSPSRSPCSPCSSGSRR